jgi:hypothetical protein
MFFEAIVNGIIFLYSLTEWVVREGVGAGGRNDPSFVCTYE